VECASAIARLEDEGALDEAAARGAFQRLTQLATGWHEVDPRDSTRETVHPLRAADALQLAAAFIAAERRLTEFPPCPGTLTMSQPQYSQSPVNDLLESLNGRRVLVQRPSWLGAGRFRHQLARAAIAATIAARNASEPPDVPVLRNVGCGGGEN
jgi:hypothetical protein